MIGIIISRLQSLIWIPAQGVGSRFTLQTCYMMHRMGNGDSCSNWVNRYFDTA